MTARGSACALETVLCIIARVWTTDGVQFGLALSPARLTTVLGVTDTSSARRAASDSSGRTPGIFS
jgi:hypothetical protein